MRRGFWLSGLIMGLASASAAAQSLQVPAIEVVGVAPLPGTGISRDAVPSNVQGLGAEVLERGHGAGMGALLERRLGSVTSSDTGGNSFQPSLSFRGFNASGVMGEPQGLAIYQNGVRINESFGDLVSWDLMPSFAVNRVDILPGANPVFGLNALGGAVVMDMKTGFSFPHTEVMGAGGSFGRRRAVVEHGQNDGNLGLYAGMAHSGEDGWRAHSPSNTTQAYGDAELRGNGGSGGLSLGFGRSELTGNGPSPVDLLSQDRHAVFTYPDTTLNRQFNVAGRGNVDLSDSASLQFSTYLRQSSHRGLNGDTTNFGACNADATKLCSDPGAGEKTLTDASGNAVPASAGGSGALNRSLTETIAFGATAQLSFDNPLLGHRNSLTLGVAEDEGHTRYHSESEVGSLLSDRGVQGSGIVLGSADYLTELRSRNRYWGFYATDSVNLTDGLTLTLAGRHNLASVVLADRYGSALNGNHSYERFNGAAGLAWALAPTLTAFAGYGEANRAPTAAELSCADVSKPCRFPNAFLSDPNLRQVVSRSVEAGLRGHDQAADKSWSQSWSLAAYGSQNQDDIIFVASGQTTGTGYFRNAGRTQRLGLEASGQGRFGSFGWFVNYGLIKATFDNDLTLRSPNNPGADADGNIFVRRGSPMAGIPQHSLKLGASYALTDEWDLAVDSALYSSRRLRGDDAGLGRRLGGYGVVNADTEYRLTESASVFLRAENLLDQRYESFGTYGDPTQVFPNDSDNQFRTPGQPRSFWLGARARF